MAKNKNVVYLKEYLKSQSGSLENKIVVGSDIMPAEAVQLAVDHSPIQIVTNGYDECRVIKIKDDLQFFFDNPAKALIDVDEGDENCLEINFVSSTKKDDFLKNVELFLKASKFRKVRDDIYLIADELFTNFSKSALDSKTNMKFAIESNDEYIVVCCRDKFGSLKPQSMIENMQRCFKKGIMGAIKKDQEGGAGIGSYLIYTLGVGMVISVDPKFGTLVSIWMPKKLYHEERIELNKSLIIIESKES